VNINYSQLCFITMMSMINRDCPDLKIVVIMANQENPGSEFLNRQDTSEISVSIRGLKEKNLIRVFYLLFVNNPGYDVKNC